MFHGIGRGTPLPLHYTLVPARVEGGDLNTHAGRLARGAFHLCGNGHSESCVVFFPLQRLRLVQQERCDIWAGLTDDFLKRVEPLLADRNHDVARHQVPNE